MASENYGHTYGSTTMEGYANVQLGDRYFNVNHVYPQPQAPSRDSIQPSILLPFHRNRDFVLRHEFDTLWNRRHDLSNRTAIFGLGGVGKSHLAIEFAHRFHEENPHIWVFWVHASSVARFEESYKNIADRMQIPGRQDSSVDTLTLVKTWLSHQEYGSWVMVVDNADDEQLVLGDDKIGQPRDTSSARLPLFQYLPTVPHGRILITTRNKAAALGFTGNSRDVIPLTAMIPDTANYLLQTRLASSTVVYSWDDLCTLAQQLEYIPLAMSQAAAYICYRAPRMTVTKYIRILQEGDDNRSKLFQNPQPDPWRDREASNSIIHTFHHSFTYLQQQHPSASRLLSLMSFFDREGIPEDLLIGRYLAEDQSVSDKVAIFEEDVATLQSFDLVHQSATIDAFDMHRIVQLAIQQWLKLAQQTAEWQRRYIEILIAEFPTVDFENWPRCEFLFPHVVSMVGNDPAEESIRDIYVDVLCAAARYAELRCKYVHAETIAQRAYHVETLSGNPRTTILMKTLVIIGNSLLERQRPEAAEEVYRQGIRIGEQNWGPTHLGTLIVVRCLGRCFLYQHRYREAEMIFRQVLGSFELQPRLYSAWVNVCTQNLGAAFQGQGRYVEAKAMFIRAVTRSEMELDKNHPYTLGFICFLASLLRETRDWDEAFKYFTIAMTGLESVFGDQHLRTIQCRRLFEALKGEMASLGLPCP